MARAIGHLPGAPGTGSEPAFAIVTGDSTDNCQANELSAYLALLDGGTTVRPDSGDLARYEGVGSPEAYDTRYWHPDGTPQGEADDRVRAVRGFPCVPGLLDSCRAPFRASGIGLPWYPVYGNHDALLGGTLPPDSRLTELALGAHKPTDLSPEADVLALLANNETTPSAGLWGLVLGPRRKVAPDPGRRPVTPGEWITAHLQGSGRRGAHGLDAGALRVERTYYGFDQGIVRCLVLDTVNRAGGWQGSLDERQLEWLEEELLAGHRRFFDRSGRTVAHDVEDRLFVLFSHHPVETLVNCYSASGETRALAARVAALLGRFQNLVCWVNGHTHESSVRAIRSDGDLAGGYWQVTTASHVDWPQQSRLVEIALDEATGDVLVLAAMIDHAGVLDPRAGELDDPLVLAGWSRELAANAWQGRSSPEEPWGRGGAADRNVVLVVPAPFPIGGGV